MVANWIRMSRTMINASLTKLIVGSTGVSVVSSNEHAHLATVDGTGGRRLMTLPVTRATARHTAARRQGHAERAAISAGS